MLPLCNLETYFGCPPSVICHYSNLLRALYLLGVQPRVLFPSCIYCHTFLIFSLPFVFSLFPLTQCSPASAKERFFCFFSLLYFSPLPYLTLIPDVLLPLPASIFRHVPRICPRRFLCILPLFLDPSFLSETWWFVVYLVLPSYLSFSDPSTSCCASVFHPCPSIAIFSFHLLLILSSSSFRFHLFLVILDYASPWPPPAAFLYSFPPSVG